MLFLQKQAVMTQTTLQSDIAEYMFQEPDTLTSDLVDWCVSPYNFLSELENPVSIHTNDNSRCDHFNLESSNDVSQLVYTLSLLVFSVCKGSRNVLDGRERVGISPCQVNFILTTEQVIDVVVKLASWLRLSDDTMSLIQGYYLVMQKLKGEFVWCVDVYAPNEVVEALGTTLFSSPNSTVDITGTTSQFYKDWRGYEFTFINGVPMAKLNYGCFKTTIAYAKSMPHTPKLIGVSQTLQSCDLCFELLIEEDDEWVYDYVESRAEKIISLSNQEVSALIGKNGIRINSIRLYSNCTIKILPIDINLLQLPRKAIRQQIQITGTTTNVDHAIELINDFLLRWRVSDHKYIA